MGFERGHNKSKGRPKGSPNKATAEVRELAQKYTAEAVEALVALMRNPDHPGHVAAVRELLDRGHGKPAQAITGPDGGPLVIQTVRYADDPPPE